MSDVVGDAVAQMRAVAADIEDALLRVRCDRETAENLSAGAESLLDWANRLESTVPLVERDVSRMPCGCPVDAGCSGWHS